MATFWILFASLLVANVDSKPVEWRNETVPIPNIANRTHSACYYEEYCITCEVSFNNPLKNCFVHLCLIFAVSFTIVLVYNYWNNIYGMIQKYKQKKMAAAYEEIK